MSELDDLKADIETYVAIATDQATEIEHLRALLREAMLQIGYLHDKFQPTGSGEAVVARLRTELS